MNLSGNTILITGGATGIGLDLAKEFLRRGNTVLTCGRREAKLAEAREAAPGLQTRVCDIANSNDRKSLADWAISSGVNILINNAGMQREIDFTRGMDAIEEGDDEIEINLRGTIYLTAQLIPHLMQQKNASILNVTSGLGFVPLAIMPIYCATKAAMHSFTLSLRHQLKPTGVKVVEIIPGVVDTELDRGARAKRGMTFRGVTVQQVTEEVMRGLEVDAHEIPIGTAAGLMAESRANFDYVFGRMNNR